MPSKKAAPAKKRAGGKKQIGLTSALGPKVTTIVVVCVMAGGIALASWQRDQTTSLIPPAETVLASDSAVPPPSTSMKKPAKTPVSATGTTGSTTTAPAQKTDATVTGCLERTGDAFRLKDTAGDDAPKSRSWKSGFIKKGSAPITVVDPSRSLRLGSHVGRRVSVSGTLANRELRADAIHAVASSCKAN